MAAKAKVAETEGFELLELSGETCRLFSGESNLNPMPSPNGQQPPLGHRAKTLT